ncbi:MarR family winged helix-turn-helix transcriptional regulator [Kitasatospora sp. NPDC097691]|uniref:MarR family winged helix-turn-helix transcriptional regulator n=1 Tax=Kitasatospora sp. NPDC097691 TaxID=3157231 RepID=UPI003334748A
MSQREVPSTRPGPADVGLRFLAAAHRARGAIDRQMAAAGLTLSRIKLLQVLAGRGPVHQAELAEVLGQAPRSVTQTVEALERLQLVTRVVDPDDRRRKTVGLTEKGRSALTAGEQAGHQALECIFGALDAGQLADLDKLLACLETVPT